MKQNLARETLRRFLDTPIPEDVREALMDVYAPDLPTEDSYKALLDARILQLAATDPEAAELARRYGIGETG